MILALDTSTAIASVALYDGTVSAEITWYSGRNHSVELMGQVENLLKLRRLSTTDLEAIAAAIGPGSYTGLRVGLAAAKGLCLALSVPMIGVCSLDVLAEGQAASSLPVRPLLDAGRHRYATAVYRREGETMNRLSPIEGRTVPEILAALSEETLLCGDLGEVRASPDLEASRHARLASPASSLRRAGHLAEMAWKRLRRNEVDDPRRLEAVYLSRED